MSKSFTVKVDFLAATNIDKITDQIKDSVKQASKAANAMSKHLDKNRDSLNSMTRSATKMTKVLATSVVAGMGASILVGTKYQTALQDLSALTGVVGGELDMMGQRALKASQKYGMAAPNILEMNKIIASSIPALLKQPELLADVTEQAIVLGKASRMETAESTRALTTTLNQFNLEGTEAKRVINALAAGAKEGAGDIPYISEAIEKAGTTFALMGLDVEQSVAIVEAIAPKFKRASLAGNTLDKAFLKMRETGMGFTDGVFNMDDALNTIRKEMDQGISVVDTFGVEHAKVIEVLLQAQGEYTRYEKAVRGTNEAYVQAEKNMATFKEAAARAGTAIQKRLIEVFIKMEPTLTAVIDRFSEFFTTLDLKALGRLATALAIVTAGFWAFILPTQILSLKPAIIQVIALTAKMWAFNLSMLPVAAIILGIVAVLAILGYALYKYWDIVKPAMIDVWLQAKEAFGPSLSTLWEMLKQLWTVAKPVLTFIAKIVGKILVAAFLGFLEVLKVVMKYLEIMFKPIAWLIEKIQKLIDKKKELKGAGSIDGESIGVPELEIPDADGTLAVSPIVIPDLESSLIGGPGTQTLDINMKVDSEGRSTIESVDSDGEINFDAELGHMAPLNAGI